MPARFNLRVSRIRPVRRHVGVTGETYATICCETGEALVGVAQARRIVAELRRIFPEIDDRWSAEARAVAERY